MWFHSLFSLTIWNESSGQYETFTHYRLDGSENILFRVESFNNQLVRGAELTYSSYLQAVKFGFTVDELEIKAQGISIWSGKLFAG